MKNKLVFIFLFSLLFCISPVQANNWQVVRNDSVRIFYKKGKAMLAGRVLKLTEKSLRELVQLLGLPFSGEAYIFLAEKGSEWDEITQQHLPEWSQGVTRPQMGIVFLKVDPGGKDVAVVLKHELVHVLMGKNFEPGLIPRWFEEGLATLYSGEDLGQYTGVLSRANLTNSLLTLSEIETVLQFQRSKASLAYSESFLAVKLIVDAIGWQGIRHLFAQLRQTGNWDRAFYAVLEMDQTDFEWYLTKYIQDYYRWNFLLQSDFVIWVIIPALAVFAYLTVRFRKYRRYREWEREETLADEKGSWDEEQENTELP